MDQDAYNSFCATLPATSHVVQWRGAHVWKVGGALDGRAQHKVFAIATWVDGKSGGQQFGGKHNGITFKVSDIAFEVLPERDGLRPAPYLASRGMKWIQHYAEPGFSDDELKDYLTESHRLVALGLTKKLRVALGVG
jgi:predicted DNA-binding protein (MmcQ/YjbR family)